MNLDSRVEDYKFRTSDFVPFVGAIMYLYRTQRLLNKETSVDDVIERASNVRTNTNILIGYNMAVAVSPLFLK